MDLLNQVFNRVHPSQEMPSTGRKMGLNPNTYATKKTIAQGMLDVALLTANAAQLRFVLEVGKSHKFYHLLITAISISIILQIILGLLLLTLSFFDINKADFTRKANHFNNISTFFSFGISVTNAILHAFW